MPDTLRQTTFREVDLDDPFFDSLKNQYEEFAEWFGRKADESVYVIDSDIPGRIIGFIYLKIEEEAISDVNPPLAPARRIKVGTLKIDAHGTKLGERIIKKIFDHSLAASVEEIYVTVFSNHSGLIRLLQRYGFDEYGTKTTLNGQEKVFIKRFSEIAGDIRQDYPLIHTTNTRFYLLAIYPDYHTNLFPDSILRNERHHIVEDVSHTNTIHKIYVAELALTRLKSGDVVVIYRTTDIPGRARYRSVVSSVCVVEEAKSRKSFANAKDFADYALPHSVFTREELQDWYDDSSRRLFCIKMLYNAAFPRRPIRDELLTDVEISEQPRWDLRQITHDQFQRIAEISELNPRLIID